LASGSLDGIIKVWDVSGNLEGKKLEGPGGGIEVRLIVKTRCYFVVISKRTYQLEMSLFFLFFLVLNSC